MEINKDNLIVKVKEKCLSFYYDEMPFFDLEGNHGIDDSVKIVEAFFDFDVTKDSYVLKNAFVEFDNGTRIENFDNINFDQVISIKRDQDLKVISQTMGFHNKKKKNREICRK